MTNTTLLLACIALGLFAICLGFIWALCRVAGSADLEVEQQALECEAARLAARITTRVDGPGTASRY